MIESFWEQHRTPVGKQFLGAVRTVEQAGRHQFRLSDVNSCVQVSVISDEIIRVRLAPNGTFLPDFSYALQEYPFEVKKADLKVEPENVVITTSSLRLAVNRKNFIFQFYDRKGTLLNADATPSHWEENIEFGGYYLYSAKAIQDHENFYGLGDKAADLNLIHKRFTLWSTDSYAFEWGTDPLYRNIPFYMGLFDGVAYGLFYDNTYRTHFDFGLADQAQCRYVAEGGELNYYFIAGPSMIKVLQRYCQLTGTHPMPPLWSLGYHQSRWSYYPQQKLLDLASEFRSRQIPCDVLHLDIDYMEGYRCFTWDAEKFPDPVGMNRRLKALGFKTVTIVDPGIKMDPEYSLYKEGIEQGYFCRRGDDYMMEGPVWPGRCQFPDFTKPEVRDWWGDQFQMLLDSGVEGVWTDMNEPSIFGMGTFPNDVRHHYDGLRGSHRKAHNVYGMQMARATWEGLRRLQKNRRPFVLTRSCYSGVQRYAACWTGDNIGTWAHLRLANVQIQRMAMSGISFTGSDIGGFIQNADAELFIRWIQLGAFSPFMRAHSSGDTREREPWSYGPEAEVILKKFIELRYRLLPYLYTCFWQNHRYGLPIQRPIIMEEQAAHNTYRQDEFLFGDNLLVCPVFEPGQSWRRMYLPPGRWFNWWDLGAVEGGQEHDVACPIDRIPLFARAGAVVPEYPVFQSTAEIDLKELTLNIFYVMGKATSLLYEDHGETFAYEQGIFTEKQFHLSGTASRLNIHQQITGMYTPRYDSYRIRLHGLPFGVRSVKQDGRHIQDFYAYNQPGSIEVVVLKSFEKLEVIG